MLDLQEGILAAFAERAHPIEPIADRGDWAWKPPVTSRLGRFLFVAATSDAPAKRVFVPFRRPIEPTEKKRNYDNRRNHRIDTELRSNRVHWVILPHPHPPFVHAKPPAAFLGWDHIDREQRKVSPWRG